MAIYQRRRLLGVEQCLVPEHGREWIPPLSRGLKRVDMLASKLFWLHFVARVGIEPSHEHIPDTNWTLKVARQAPREIH